MNAAMLAGEFAKKGLNAEAAYIFEREPSAYLGDARIKVINRAYNRLNLPYQIAKAWLYILRQRPKVVFGFHPLSNILGALYRLVNPKARFIGTQRITAGRQSKLTAAIEKLIGSTRAYDAQIAVTNAVKASFSHYPDKFCRKIHVVHNGTPPLTPFQGSKADARGHLKMDKDAGILGCVGRLHEQKNFEFAIQLIEKLPNFKLFIAGDGPRDSFLRQQAEDLGISDRVILLGPLEGSNLTAFYKAVDILLFPSIYEGFGRVLVEAFSQGLIVIANDIDVVREVGQDACYIAPTKIETWTDFVNRILVDEPAAADMRQRALRRAGEFTVERMVGEYIRIAGLEDKSGSEC